MQAEIPCTVSTSFFLSWYVARESNVPNWFLCQSSEVLISTISC
jgi:hypothetical protein